MNKAFYTAPCVLKEIQYPARPLCLSLPAQGVEDISTGGGEYGNDDFNNRDELVSSFDKAQSETLKSNPEPWEQVRVAVGIAEYDPKTDNSLIDTIRRADDMMYDNKRERKKNNS